MKPCELPLACHYHPDRPAVYADSVPDITAANPFRHGEYAYHWIPLCWACGVERREVTTSRVTDLLHCEEQGLARLDRGRVSGLCVCEQCGRLYYDHPADRDYPYMTVLCDGSTAKL